MAQWVTNPTGNHEVAGSIPGLAVSCGIGPRCNSDYELLWLWRRPVATAPIRPLAWESLCATGAALEKAKRQKKKEKRKKETKYSKKGYDMTLFLFFFFFFCFLGPYLQNIEVPRI